MTAVSPSRTSSPSEPLLHLLEQVLRRAVGVDMRVSAARRPVRCVPPSLLWTLFVYGRFARCKSVPLQRDLDDDRRRRSPSGASRMIATTSSWTGSLVLLSSSTNSRMPPLYSKISLRPSPRSSTSVDDEARR